MSFYSGSWSHFAKIAAVCVIITTLYAAFMLWLFVATVIEKLKDRIKEKR